MGTEKDGFLADFEFANVLWMKKIVPANSSFFPKNMQSFHSILVELMLWYSIYSIT